ncbi:hypothetical protein CPJCM30710_17140 [Clostridium polyendosporum]|uniref:Anti-sigma factor RsgI-like middle domain-containing protein n=1 Tax=Clostridium polyendosporum TaxID=69208 RepID=A0A919S1U1_9CLOT|nr:hypothetical protein [Clostridium polyendosporum]GIM29048.1 hypothetical protein CPJCM30710_17140 [Clostridium polyendosporum]
MEVKGKKVLLMTSAGEFTMVKVGKELPVRGREYEGKVLVKSTINKRIIAAVASFVLIFTLGAKDYYTPVKALEIYASSNIKLELNRWDRVIEASPLNDNGRKVLSKIALNNRDIEKAVNMILEQVSKENILGGQHQISINSINGKLNIDNLKKIIEEKGLKIIDINSYNENNKIKSQQSEVINEEKSNSKNNEEKNLSENKSNKSIDNKGNNGREVNNSNKHSISQDQDTNKDVNYSKNSQDNKIKSSSSSSNEKEIKGNSKQQLKDTGIEKTDGNYKHNLQDTQGSNEQSNSSEKENNTIKKK